MAILEMLAQSLAPTACTTIEEVGSTGVGALTVAFLVLAITTIIFIARSAVPGWILTCSTVKSAVESFPAEALQAHGALRIHIEF